jgi:hypothetical protein
LSPALPWSQASPIQRRGNVWNLGHHDGDVAGVGLVLAGDEVPCSKVDEAAESPRSAVAATMDRSTNVVQYFRNLCASEWSDMDDGAVHPVDAGAGGIQGVGFTVNKERAEPS